MPTGFVDRRYFSDRKFGFRLFRNASTPSAKLAAPKHDALGKFDPYGLGASTLDLAKAICLREGINSCLQWMKGCNHIQGWPASGLPTTVLDR